MKHLLAVIAFLFVAHSASALRYPDVAGTWRGTIAEKNPSGNYTVKAVVQIVPFGASGLAIAKKITNEFGNVFIEKSHLNTQGIAAQVTTVSGHVYCQGPGNWSSGRNALRVRVKLTYYEGTVFTQITTLTFRGNRLIYRSKNNGGLLQTGVLKRK